MAGAAGTTWKLAVAIQADAKNFTAGMRAAERDLQSLAKETANTSSATERGSQAIKAAWATAGMAVTAAAAMLVKDAFKFEGAMRNVNSIAKMSEGDLAAASAAVLDMSRSFRVSATDLAEGLYDIESSGFNKTSDAMTVLGASATAASAGLTDTATSSRVITAALNAYGLQASDAEHVSNVLFKGVEAGVLTFEDMAASMSNAIPAAAAAHVSIEELTSGVAAMTLAGVGAAEASTSMSRMIESLLTPSDELAQTLHTLGYESGSQALATDGLATVMSKLQEASKGNIDTLLQWFPEIRSARGALALMSQEGENYRRVQDAVAKADDGAGAAKAAMAEQMKGAAAQIALFTQTIKAGATQAILVLLPHVREVLDILRELGGSAAKVATEVAQRLEPAWQAAGQTFRHVADIATTLWQAAEPIARTFAAIVGGTVIAGINVMAKGLETVTRVLSEHPGLLQAIGVAMATFAIAKTMIWVTELGRTSPAIFNVIGSIGQLGSKALSTFSSLKAGASLASEAFTKSFVGAGGGLKGLADGAKSAGSAVSSMGSGMVGAINPVTAIATVAALAIVGVAMAWKDSQEAAEAARKAAEEYGDAVKEAMDAGTSVDPSKMFAGLTMNKDTELGKITQQEEFKKAMDALGITFEEFNAALAEAGPRGEKMFMDIAAKAEDFDSVMETMGGTSDFDDGMQRLGQIGTKNLEDLKRAGGPAAGAIADIVKEQKAAALAAGEYGTSLVTVTDFSKKEISAMRERGDVLKEIRSNGTKYALVRNKEEVDGAALYNRVTKQMQEQGIALDSNGQAVQKLSKAQQELVDKTGVGEAKFRALTAAQQQQLTVLDALEPAAAQLSQRLSSGGFGPQPGLDALRGQLSAALPIMRDGKVSAAELSNFQTSLGLTAEQAAARLGSMSDGVAKASQELTGAFPTIGNAAANVKIPVDQLDGSIKEVQMTADNFSLDKLLEEQQKLIDAQLKANDNMQALLKAGQTAIIQQAQSMPPELRGAFLSAVMEMPEDKRAALEAKFLGQQSQLADSGARLVEAGYGTLDLNTPTVAAALKARAGQVDVLGQPITTDVVAHPDTTVAEQVLAEAARNRDTQITARAETSQASYDIQNLTQPRTIEIKSWYSGAMRAGGVIEYARNGLVARDGEHLTHWAEKGTGGEVYVPKNIGHNRAVSLLQVAAQWHGARVIPMAQGGVFDRPISSSNSAGIVSYNTTLNVSFSPAIEVSGSSVSPQQVLDAIRGQVPQLGELLRREQAGRR